MRIKGSPVWYRLARRRLASIWVLLLPLVLVGLLVAVPRPPLRLPIIGAHLVSALCCLMQPRGFVQRRGEEK